MGPSDDSAAVRLGNLVEGVLLIDGAQANVAASGLPQRSWSEPRGAEFAPPIEVQL